VRILYFADIRFPLDRANGIQTMETCCALAGRGHRVHLVVRPDTVQPARDPFAFYGHVPLAGLTIDRAPVRGAPIMRRVGYLNFALGRAIGGGPGGVIFTRDLGLAALLTRVPAPMRAPLIYESHGYAPEVAETLPAMLATATAPGSRKLRRLAGREARVWRQADGYVTITAALAQALTGRFGDRPHLLVAPDGVRQDLLQEKTPPAPAGRPVVAYAGHLYPWKGVDVLIRALAGIPEADGLIVGGHDGEPDLARLRTLAATMGVAGRVTFTGLVPPHEVPARLAAASCLVLPNPPSAASSTFTSPLKLFEYMAAGRPIVASDLPAIREVLRDGANAVLVAPGDPEALARGIRQVLGDPAFASRLAAAARTDAAGYTWERRAETLERLFEEVAGGRP
jgi:glycosyltransferase involved in cell wall biosynthesis